MKQDKPGPENPGEGFIANLRELQSECSQLSELDEMERTYALRLVESLKALQSYVDAAISLRIENFGHYPYQPKQAYLVSDAVVVMTNADGSTLSLPLAQLKPQDILSIVEDCTPALKKIISEKRKVVGGRVDLLDRALKDLKKASGTMKQRKDELVEEPEGDLVRSSITS